MGIKKIHLIGHSQGGWPVTRIALDHPELVKSLVIVDSGTMAPSDPLDRATAFYVYSIYFLNPPEGPTLESIRRGMEMNAYSLNNLTEEKVRRAYELTYLDKMVEARQQMRSHDMNPGNPTFQAMKQMTLEEIEAGGLKMPTLVIWGYKDPSAVYEVGLELFKLLSLNVPGSGFRLFDGCGHAAYVEYPDLFNRTIRGFCGVYASPPVD
jgi:pimeloyl-ACP methyl ester carboxylesterase